MSKKLIAEIFGIVSIAIVVVLWLFGTFQTQDAAAKVEHRIDEQRDRILLFDDKLDKISDDVSFIRGKLEGNDEEKK